jgi:uncharacterized membrane protein
MIAVLTGMGLSAAAGLNAYIPFLVVALIAKYTDLIVLPSAYGWIESWWAIGIGSALLLTEVVVDKVPAVDTVNDAVQTFIRPTMGGLLAAATAGAAELDKSVRCSTRGSAWCSASWWPASSTSARRRPGPRPTSRRSAWAPRCSRPSRTAPRSV